MGRFSLSLVPTCHRERALQAGVSPEVVGCGLHWLRLTCLHAVLVREVEGEEASGEDRYHNERCHVLKDTPGRQDEVISGFDQTVPGG